MNRGEKGKTNILELILLAVLLLVFGGLAILGWVNGALNLALLNTALVLLVMYAINVIRKQGVRAPTSYERFKAWMSVRPVIIGLVGLGLMALGVQYVFPATFDWPSGTKVLLVGVPLLIWAGALFYTLQRAPGRIEMDAAYKRRVGYEAKE